jgi:hypothetical protein
VTLFTETKWFGLHGVSDVNSRLIGCLDLLWETTITPNTLSTDQSVNHGFLFPEARIETYIPVSLTVPINE